jgi:L-alanine-DL-glutamate epimerase-like enolase superfamily enzyme
MCLPRQAGLPACTAETGAAEHGRAQSSRAQPPEKACMKISTIEAIPVAYPEPNDHGAVRHLCLARVQADDGQIGWGEAVTMWPEASLATKALIEGMAPLLIGRSPLETDALWRTLKEHAWWYGVGGIASFAIAALDIATWDLKGKALGVSVLDLLGGSSKDRLPTIVSCHATRAEIPALVDEMAAWLATGIHGIKVGFGKRGDARLGFEQARDVAFVQALRSTLGPDKTIMIDIGNAIRWDVGTAVARTHGMEPYDIAWIEEPLGPDDPGGYATLRAKTPTRIAYGEREWNRAGYRRILETGTVDVVGVDPGRAEGITGVLRVCADVEAARVQANAHAWSSSIVTAASLAISFSTPACRQFEVKPLWNPMQHELVAKPLVPLNGWMHPPTGPGLGIEVLEDVVNRYRVH